MKEVLQFLQDLSEHNDKPWFEANKQRYLAAKANVDRLAEELIDAIRTFDDSIGPLTPKDCTWRIYRDTRFSHDKRPYKTQMGVYVARGGKKAGFSGYYFQIGAPDAGHMLAAVFKTTKPFLDYINRAIDYCREEMTVHPSLRCKE